MSNLIKQLTDLANYQHSDLSVAQEAADEIKRLLREIVNRNQRAIDGDKAVAVRDGLIARIEQLERELAEAERHRVKNRETALKYHSQLTEAQALLREARNRAEIDLMSVGHSPESEPRYLAMYDLSEWIARIDAALGAAEEKP